MRTDTDLLGTIEIPDDTYYGIQTTRSIYLGDISFSKLNFYPEVVEAVIKVKRACALANVDIGAMKPEIGEAIVAACNEILDGKLSDQFVVDMYAGGGAIAINMNVNEVIANRANEILTGRKGYDKVHPNTHVNMCQSTNDAIPSAMKIVCHSAATKLIDAVKLLEKSLNNKVDEFGDAVKLARTCLNDALPITFAQEFSGYASGISRQRKRLESAMSDWLSLTLSGTAVGTGVGTMPGYREAVYKRLQETVHPTIRCSDNIFDGMQNADDYLYLSGLVKCLAVTISKMCYDLKLMASGPFAGFGEINLPAVQAGSSIMPGKVNPAIPEMLIQVAQQTCGNDQVITMAVEKGELDLNIFDQILLKSVLDSMSLLTKAIPILCCRCIDGLSINQQKSLSDAERTTALVTMVSVVHGYKTGLKIALESIEKKIPVKEAAIATGQFTKEQADEFFDPLLLTSPERMHDLLTRYKALRDV